MTLPEPQTLPLPMQGMASVVDGAEIFVLQERLSHAKKHALLYLCRDDARMERLAAMVRFFIPKAQLVTFPAWDCLPYDRVSPNVSVVSARVRALCAMTVATPQKEAPLIVISTANAAIQRVAPRAVIGPASRFFTVGETIDRHVLQHFLVDHGYSNVATAMEPGEFAVRGSILDVVPPGEGGEQTQGYRLDFFGDELESIRLYDPVTQISAGNVLELSLMPASEVLLNKETIQRFRDEYRTRFGLPGDEDSFYHAMVEGRHFPGMEHWLPLFYERLETLFDYVPDALILQDFLLPEALAEREVLIAENYEARQRPEAQQGEQYHPLPPEMLYLSEAELQENWQIQETVPLTPHRVPEGGAKSATTQWRNMEYQSVPAFFTEAAKERKTAFEQAKIYLTAQGSGRRSVVTCPTEGARTRMAGLLREYELHSREIHSREEMFALPKDGTLIGLALLPLEQGVMTQELLLISEQDLLGERIYRKQSNKKAAEKFLSEAANLIPGELVVHKDHGIGRFERLETMTVSDRTHDFIRLTYAGDDRLFLPVESMNVLRRYGPAESDVPLDSLGGLSWQKRTAAIKKRIQITAQELLVIAAKRATRTAPEYVPDGKQYSQFCSRFPYSETVDQQRSIDDVLSDLSSGKPMDRLVCGDVGFGKTEVALRAASAVVCPAEGYGKAQVALIAPTTLLTRQHYQTFVNRFAGMGVRIRQLSRMVKSKEAAETREMLEAGEVDIIIGTHALLSKQVAFDNLGLLIVDEEQRFGVAQKEKLKKWRAVTHVLTMTATPIPRTLQLSLAGLRELSLITTPPVDRLAVRTYVMPFDGVILRDAILREHYRGGRVFFVCPRIKDVEEIEEKIRALVPEVKLGVAHGRMPPETLDEVMNAFHDGQYDVLLSTTIVESGLDIPAANTIIIHRADRFGLSQLYQLRGRVGRGKLRGYAYLTLPPRIVPTEQAQKRLNVMQKLDTLGSGFSLASHDMDIRGFGNLLGDEQSGHIREVGVELYQDMLQEAIDALKAGGSESEGSPVFEPQITLGISVLIPENYVQDLSLRMGLYRRIASLKDIEELEAMETELIDRFGTLPEEVKNLFVVVKMKQDCLKMGVERIDAGPKGAKLTFHEAHKIEPQKLIAWVGQNPVKFKMTPEGVVIQHQDWKKDDVRVEGVSRYVAEILELMPEKGGKEV